jgi:hypothetical protein
LEEHSASIFRVEEKSSKPTSKQVADAEDDTLQHKYWLMLNRRE